MTRRVLLIACLAPLWSCRAPSGEQTFPAVMEPTPKVEPCHLKEIQRTSPYYEARCENRELE